MCPKSKHYPLSLMISFLSQNPKSILFTSHYIIKMGCFTSLCHNDNDLENEKGQFAALVVSENAPPPIVGRECSDGVIPLFAPAPSDDDVIMSSDSEIEDDESEKYYSNEQN